MSKGTVHSYTNDEDELQLFHLAEVPSRTAWNQRKRKQLQYAKVQTVYANETKNRLT